MNQISRITGIQEIGLQQQMQVPSLLTRQRTAIFDQLVASKEFVAFRNINSTISVADIAAVADAIAQKYSTSQTIDDFFNNSRTGISALLTAFDGLPTGRARSDALVNVLGVNSAIAGRFANSSTGSFGTINFADDVAILSSNTTLFSPSTTTTPLSTTTTPPASTGGTSPSIKVDGKSTDFFEWLTKFFQAIFSGDFTKIFDKTFDLTNAKYDDNQSITDVDVKKGTAAYYNDPAHANELKTAFDRADLNNAKLQELFLQNPDAKAFTDALNKQSENVNLQLYKATPRILKVITSTPLGTTGPGTIKNLRGSPDFPITVGIDGRVSAGDYTALQNDGSIAGNQFRASYRLVGSSYQELDATGNPAFDYVAETGAGRTTAKAGNLGLDFAKLMINQNGGKLKFNNPANLGNQVEIDFAAPASYQAGRAQLIGKALKEPSNPANATLLALIDAPIKSVGDLVKENIALVSAELVSDAKTAWAEANYANINDPSKITSLGNYVDQAKIDAIAGSKKFKFKLKVGGKDTEVEYTLNELLVTAGTTGNVPLATLKNLGLNTDIDKSFNLDDYGKKYEILTTPVKNADKVDNSYDFIRAVYSRDSKAHKALLGLGISADDMKAFADNLLYQMKAGLDIKKIAITNDADFKTYLNNFGSSSVNTNTLNTYRDDARSGHKSALTTLFPKLDGITNPEKVLSRDVLTSYDALTAAYGIRKDENIRDKLEQKTANSNGAPTYSYADHLTNLLAAQAIMSDSYKSTFGGSGKISYNRGNFLSQCKNDYQRYIINSVLNDLIEDDQINNNGRYSNKEMRTIYDRVNDVVKKSLDNLNIDKNQYSDVGDLIKVNESTLTDLQNIYVNTKFVSAMEFAEGRDGFNFRNRGLVPKGKGRVADAIGFGKGDIYEAREPALNLESKAEKDISQEESWEVRASRFSDRVSKIFNKFNNDKSSPANEALKNMSYIMANNPDDFVNNRGFQIAYNSFYENMEMLDPTKSDKSFQNALDDLDKQITKWGGVFGGKEAFDDKAAVIASLKKTIRNEDIILSLGAELDKFGVDGVSNTFNINGEINNNYNKNLPKEADNKSADEKIIRDNLSNLEKMTNRLGDNTLDAEFREEFNEMVEKLKVLSDGSNNASYTHAYNAMMVKKGELGIK